MMTPEQAAEKIGPGAWALETTMPDGSRQMLLRSGATVSIKWIDGSLRLRVDRGGLDGVEEVVLTNFEARAVADLLNDEDC